MMRAQWSAPLFVEGHLFGLGFALGKIVINSACQRVVVSLVGKGLGHQGLVLPF